MMLELFSLQFIISFALVILNNSGRIWRLSVSFDIRILNFKIHLLNIIV